MENELIDYLISSQSSQRLSKARTTLSAPFPTELGKDDMDYLERKMEGLKWVEVLNALEGKYENFNLPYSVHSLWFFKSIRRIKSYQYNLGI